MDGCCLFLSRPRWRGTMISSSSSSSSCAAGHPSGDVSQPEIYEREWRRQEAAYFNSPILPGILASQLAWERQPAPSSTQSVSDARPPACGNAQTCMHSSFKFVQLNPAAGVPSKASDCYLIYNRLRSVPFHRKGHDATHLMGNPTAARSSAFVHGCASAAVTSAYRSHLSGVITRARGIVPCTSTTIDESCSARSCGKSAEMRGCWKYQARLATSERLHSASPRIPL